jgi:toxin secretion/phage lysis holin
VLILEDIKKWFISLALGIWATFTQNYAIILTFVVIAIVLDLITGLVKSKATGEGWSSKKGSKGFWKKIALLVAFGFGIFLDTFIPYALGVISIDLPFNSPFALVIGVYIILNESISICENLYETNPHTLPTWVKSLLANANDKINRGE